jgi:hypothetical protein
MPIDLGTLDKGQLRTLLANAERKGAADLITTVLQEMHRRGLARRGEYAALSWNQDRVDVALAPFATIAATVKNNERTKYSQAGGGRIGSPKDDPEHIWVQSYSAIKISGIVNAEFLCEIKSPGDDPMFSLSLNEGVEAQRAAKVIRTFEPDQLPEALVEWKMIAQLASTTSTEP